LKRSVGILGYGQLGKYLVDKITNDVVVSKYLELSFVWNRSIEKLHDLPVDYRMTNEKLSEGLKTLIARDAMPDIIVEASHADILKEHGETLLEYSDLFMTSITAMADMKLHEALVSASKSHCIYLPSGAAWGVSDIIKLDRAGNLEKLKVTMNFGADALRLNDPLAQELTKFKNDDSQKEILLYKGDLRRLAQLAPNNVNTMCCLALAAPSIGFEHIIINLLAHKHNDNHIVEIDCYGPNGFHVKTIRTNPAAKSAVTGKQTFQSFLSSLLEARGRSNGMYFC
jgi:predicted dinucleotide-utilizing enzyme